MNVITADMPVRYIPVSTEPPKTFEPFEVKENALEVLLMSISRRSLLQNSAAISFTSTLGLSACGEKTAVAPKSGRKDISALLNSASDLLVTAYPETASSAGLDKGALTFLMGIWRC